MIDSKLPNVGTTIFSIMSSLANQNNAINLGQGFPDFDCDPALIDQVQASMKAGLNQYPQMTGAQELREVISEKIQKLHGRYYDPNSEVTITAGGTQGIFTVIQSLVRLNDEVIIIEPAYDSYGPAVELAGGKVIAVQMELDALTRNYQIPWEAIQNNLSNKTRLIIINTPHNPTGMTWDQNDLNKLNDILINTNVYVCSDEVYEHMVYDGIAHKSVSSHSQLSQRSFVISSFGKTLHVTGWKVGYVVAPHDLTDEFRKTHQFNVFTVNTPMQHGIAKYLKNPSCYLDLPNFYQQKRDYFRQGLEKTKLNLLPTPGTYFQCVDYSQLHIPEVKLNEINFCKWLTNEIGVAAIPLSAFYQNSVNHSVIRFCFAKKEETLKKAIDRLKKL